MIVLLSFLLKYARIILNLLELYALYINSVGMVYTYSRICRCSFNGVLSVVLSYVKIIRD